MTEAFIFGCGCAFLIGGFQTIAGYLNGPREHGMLETIPWSGIAWLGKTARFALIAAAAVTILGLQYFRRKTLTSRLLVVVFGFAILATQFLPWRPAFAIEKGLSPKPGYRGIEDKPIRAKFDYSLTIFGLAKSYSIPALGGSERMPSFGWCETKMNEAGTAVELRCMQPGNAPTCATLFLENGKSGQRNPARSSCHGDYSPFSGWYSGDNMAHFGANIPFRDASGLAKFPVDGPQLPQSHVVIRVYEPEDHLTRSLVIPEIKLKDWEAQ